MRSTIGSVRTMGKRLSLPRLGIVMACLLCAVLATPLIARPQSTDIVRMPWGTPDLSGFWEYSTITPLQRPEEFADKARLTTEEVVAYLPGRLEAIGRERDLQLNADWWEPGALTDGRTSLIIDPSNGRLPAMTEVARHRARTLGLRSRLRPADGPEDRERYERCIMGRTVPLLAVAPNRLLQIFQTPSHLVILHEQNSDVRVIPIGTVPSLAPGIRQWQGHSRGHWEGDTLVVETGNFNGAWTLNGTSANMQVVERFSPTEDGAIDFAFTVDDSESFAEPWTVMFPITPAAGPLFENACHEGNYSMPLILSGARAQERAELGVFR